MSPSRPFILRPVATSLLMLGLLLVGAVAYLQLPVSALPQVDYPTIQVLTFYPGASPDVMASSVTTPLERQFGEVPGLTQMTSTSSFGASLITLQFDLKEDIDVAEQEVQASINAATTYLPRDLPNPPTYSKVNPADTPILTLALTSQTLPLQKVEDFADTNLAQKISQLSGVGLVTISGGQKPAVRVLANPLELASYGMSLEDLRVALQNANVDQAKGNLQGPRQSYTIEDNDQLLSSANYLPLIVAYRNGSPVRLSDVAQVVDGAENDTLAAWMNKQPAVILNIQRQPGTNIIGVADRVKTLLPELQASLPSSIHVVTLTDRTTTIRASVKDVQFELLLTIALVVMVMFLFLRSAAATVIPSVAVPLSIVGTFGVMYLAGFSLDNLSLMALTISTGFVVDDAIVMIENIARFIEGGDSPLQAALKGSEQIGFTIVSLTVSLIAVLIPLLFMGDIIGRLFREFAITLGVTILVSAFVSLTLTPMMCSRFLRHHEGRHSLAYRVIEAFFVGLLAFYQRTLDVALRHRFITLLTFLATAALTVVLYIDIPKGFFPAQDTGVVIGVSEGAQDVSFKKMARIQARLDKVIAADPDVAAYGATVGSGIGSETVNNGRTYIALKPWDQRVGGSAQDFINRIRPKLAKVEGGQLFLQAAQDIRVGGRLSKTQYQYTLQDA
ncbi:MAG: efflux RND transporter permease subunit, partial [Candidatus Acidiferrales bacterium]